MISVLNILLVILLVVMNGFFVASEFAMVKIRDTRIETLIEEGVANAKYCRSVKKNLNSYLSACQLGITLASLGLGWVGEPAIAVLIRPLLEYLGLGNTVIHTVSFIIAFSFITAFHIVLGELVPKSLAILNTERVMLVTSAPLILFYKIMYPIIWLFNVSTNIFLKPFGLSQADEVVDPHTNDELRILVEESYKSGLIEASEQKFVDNVFDFADKIAKEIMTPRTDMICLFKADPVERILTITKEEQYTRYPVCGKNKDDILGFVHIKDIYEQKIEANEVNIGSIIRKITLVPESIPINKLLERFQKEKVQMAILVDEYGGTSGLVTIEDVLEEIVGEIQDEFDNETIPIIENDDNTFTINGLVHIDDINELLGLDIECDTFDSIGGWVYSRAGMSLKENQKILYEGYEFIISELDKTRVKSITVRKTI